MKWEAAMPLDVKIQILKDNAGTPVYRVASSVGRNMSVVRDFKSREEAERFATPKSKPSAKGRADS
jgi:hypothetical protein